MLLVVNEHTAQLDRALGKCRLDYEILTEAITNTQREIPDELNSS
jgi:hypothetical protein